MILQWLAFAYICLKGVLVVNNQPAQPPIDIIVDLGFWIIAFLIVLEEKTKYKYALEANEQLINENSTLEVYRQEHYELSEAITWFMRRLQWVSESRK